MNKLRVGIYTLGCKVNQQESEMISRQFALLGFELAAPGERADAYIINSCTVTAAADSKSRQRIRQAKALNPDALVAVIGCYPQAAREEVARMEEVDLVLGSADKEGVADQVGKLLRRARNDKRDCAQNEGGELVSAESGGANEAGGSPRERTRAWLKACDGCDRFCSYCVIPSARGAVRSAAPAQIAREARGLIAAGYKEIVVTGINLALYGTDLKGARALSAAGAGKPADGIFALLSRLCSLDGEYRIRLGSLEPTVIDASAAARIAGLSRVCPHFHLSLQSGSDRVLQKMKRRYTAEGYAEILAALRGLDPHFAVTTDVIAGFPGETDEDFSDSLSFVRAAGFAKVHVFRYSKRKGTAAADMPGHLPNAVKAERAAALAKAAEEGAAAFREGCNGTLRRTLLFGPDKGGRFVRGITDNGIDVRVPAGAFENPAAAENTFCDLELTREIIGGFS
ncbi:MAG: tRNA (N(6)-L-threonylcarbamoyladenosine(37)-C(2))-methylthiotransferase MtaB [Clostridiales Family XIII bacterium]|jgi:threonylcarbamoyladenosine tRNA methylthiotransferase MtaB|nr:tRNA (N(6)-L-threonylcarbamoyladenosine(37)-C(2))-methylthiotransferase MtaB [Clostridiales Family XIII bacterium]